MGSRLVYSTDGSNPERLKEARPGNDRSGLGRPGAAIPAAPRDGWVRLWRVKGGRGGKTATLITGIEASAGQLEAIALQLRRFVGAGGGVHDGAIELQGDHRERLQKRLTELGYRVKQAGG